MRAYSLFFVDPLRSQELARRATTLSASAGDAFTEDWATAIDAYTLNRRDRHAAATAVARPAYERALARNDRFCGSFLLGIEMIARMHTGDVRQASAIGHEVMSLAEPLGDYFAYGSNATNVAHAFGLAGDIDRGKAIMARIVHDIDRSSHVDVIAYMFSVGLLHLWSGHPETALPWFELGIGQRDTYEWTATRCLAPLATTLRMLGRVDEAARAAARAAEAAVEVDSPQILAFACDEQARLAATDDPARAFDLHHQALALRREHGLRTYLPDSLAALATLTASTGSPHAATRMLAAGAVGPGTDRIPQAPRRPARPRPHRRPAEARARRRRLPRAVGRRQRADHGPGRSPTPLAAAAHATAPAPAGRASAPPSSPSPAWWPTACPTPRSLGGCSSAAAP